MEQLAEAKMLVIGIAVDVQHPAEEGDRMLAGEGVYDGWSLPECDVKIIIAFLG